MKKILLSAFAILSVAGTATAAPFILPASTPIYFQFNNLEQVNATNSLVVPGGYNGINTQGNWGVFNISSIQHGGVSIPHQNIGGGPVIWSDDGAGGPSGVAGQITGIFYDITLTGPTTATGGVIDLYWHDDFPITAACLANTANVCEPNAATVDRFTDNGGTATFLARLFFASGIKPGDNITTISSNIDPTATGGEQGQANSYANVDLSTPGVWTSLLDGNWFQPDGKIRDLRFANRFDALPSWDAPANSALGTTIGLQSNDPGKVFTAPEPATLLLLGVGLSLAGMRLRRRTNA